MTQSNSKHSIHCLYQYNLARLGLHDTPDMRVLFWDAHDALEWHTDIDLHIVPEFVKDPPCPRCVKPWDLIPTHQVLPFIKGTEYLHVPGTETTLEHYQLKLKVAPDTQAHLTELAVNSIDLAASHQAAIRTLKEMAYKNGWMNHG